jgi:hypothetical protein
MRFWSPILAAFVVASTVNGALLFEDRHGGANGEEMIYRFEAGAASANSLIEQSKAVKIATVWAARYYGIGNPVVTNAQERSMPIRYWLIAFTASGHSKGGNYYSIVLPNGSVVEPNVSRQNFTASPSMVDVTKDTELQAPVKNLEIHGEVIFTYGFGKGLRSCGP